MSTKKSEVDLERVKGGYPHGIFRSALLGFAIVSVLFGLRYLLRSFYRFHTWDW
jgi:hypothetical protein